MKKIALILLICMYTLSSFGVGISQFYCCGKLKTTSLSFAHAVTEKCSNQKAMAGCCKTTFKSFQVKDSHVAATALTNPAKFFTDLQIYFGVLSTNVIISSAVISIVYTGNAPPPLHYNLPIYTLYCAYLI